MPSARRTRRQFLKTTATAVAGTLAAPYLSAPARAASKELVFVSWGGSYQDGQSKAYIEPFEQATGVKVIQTSGVDLAKLQAQVQANHVEWDIVSLPDRLRFAAVRQGLLAPLDYKVIDVNGILPKVVTEYSVGHILVIMQLVYSTQFYKSGTEPKTWADFWNLKFPGVRGMFNGPTYILEIALLADGVPKDKLYPLDVPRAFKSLDRIKKALVWWTEFPQAGVMLKSGEINLTPWTRGITSKFAGDPVSVSFNDAILSYEGWVVPKGAPHADAAMQFINFAIKPERQAELAKLIAYGPTNQKALDLIDAKLAQILPSYPDNWKQGALFDGTWWGENLAKVTEQWNEWRLS